MSITNTTVKQRYNCDGSVVNFAIPFVFSDTDEILVYLRDESVDPITETLLLEGSGHEYTLTGGTVAQPVYVTTNTAYAATYKIVIKRSTPLTQELEISENDPLPANDLEEGLDKHTRQNQELNETMRRAVLLPVSSDLLDLTYPDPVAYEYFRWNTTADEVEAIALSATAPLVYTESTGLFAMPAAASGVSGYLTAADWAYFTAKLTPGIANIVDADISAAASITLSKLAPLTASRLLVSDAGGVISVSTATSTEAGYLSGVTSGIQAQLNNKYQSGDSPTFATITNTTAANLAGYLSMSRRDESSAATINALISSKSYVKLTATVTTINGIAAGVDGQLIVIYNNTGSSVTLNNSSGSASASDQIITSDGNAIALADKTPQAFIYDSGQSKWVVWGGGGGGGGSLTGPGSTTDNAVVRWDGAVGGTVQDSSVTVSDTGLLTTTNLIVSALTATTVPYLDGSKQLASSAVTPTELGYVSGVTSAIQTQLGVKTTYTANQYGVVLSGAAYTMVVLAPDAATTKFLKSGGASANPSWSAVDLAAADVTGVLPMANGGTNKNMTAVNGGVIWSDADSMEVTAAGTATQVLTSGGAATPTWQYGLIPQIFGSTGSPRSVVAATGIVSGSSHMSTTAYEQIVFVTMSSADADVTANPQVSNGTVVGQRMKIIGTSDSTPVLLEDGNGLALRGDITIGQYVVLDLMWDGTNWMEFSRSL